MFEQTPTLPLLNQQEENSLAQQIQAAQLAAHSFLSNKITLEEKERIEYAGAIARDMLIRSNIRLVYTIAYKFKSRNLPMMDLVSEGFIGLIRAAEGFNSDGTARFSTYASWWINQSIKKVMSNAHLVSIPDYMNQSVPRWFRHRTLFMSKHGYEPIIEDMADFIELPLRKARQIYLAAIAYQSRAIGRVDSKDEDIHQIEDYPDTEPKDVVDDIELVRVAMQRFAETADERTMLILRLRFGMNDEYGEGCG